MLPIDCRRCEFIDFDDGKGYICACPPKDRPCRDRDDDEERGVSNDDH